MLELRGKIDTWISREVEGKNWDAKKKAMLTNSLYSETEKIIKKRILTRRQQ